MMNLKFGIALSLSLVSLGLLSATPVFADKTAPTKGVVKQSPTPGVQTTGGIDKFTGIDATDNPCTSSTTFADMPGMTVSFNTGGKGRVIGLFQGEWIGGTGRALLRLVVDGVVVPGPGDSSAPFAPHEGTVVSTNGFNFISNTVLAGAHTATVQWATVDSTVCVDERSFVVFHKL